VSICPHCRGSGLVKMPESVMLDVMRHIQLAAARQWPQIKAQLERGEDFGKIATEVSEWPTARNGGFLGTFRYGDFGKRIHVLRSLAPPKPGMSGSTLIGASGPTS